MKTGARQRAVITVETVPNRDGWDALWSIYLEAFEPLQSLALLNHLYARESFEALLAEPRVLKLIAWVSGVPVGMAMITSGLDLVPQISPAFLVETYPEQSARDAVFFGIMVFVDEAHRRSSLFARLVAGMGQITAEHAGVVVFDICRHNVTEFELDAQMRAIARWFPESSFEEVDRQSYFSVNLPKPIESRLPVTFTVIAPGHVDELTADPVAVA